jgi:hypothetical protein
MRTFLAQPITPAKRAECSRSRTQGSRDVSRSGQGRRRQWTGCAVARRSPW